MIKVNNITIEQKYFPDGTILLPNIIQNFKKDEEIVISWIFENIQEQILLSYITKYLKKIYPNKLFKLNLPYIPNARMDRSEGSLVLTLKYFAEDINSLKFDEVIVFDPHSSVALALIDNVSVNNMLYCEVLESIIDRISPDNLFLPDEGMKKKLENLNYEENNSLHNKIANIGVSFGMKKRDFSTGVIKGLSVVSDGISLENKNILIIDDICSKGGTFYHSAKQLKKMGANKIFLYISHCENSILDGELINSGLIDKIYTTNTIFTKENKLIEVIKAH